MLRVFVGASSKENIDKRYFDVCRSLADKIASIEGVELVYGCCNKGIMGIFYEAFWKMKRKVLGVVSKYYKDDIEEGAYSEVIVCDTTTERFLEIYKNSDLLLFLPGGVGTLSELFSAIEEGRIGNGKKIILYNYEFFYTPIIRELYRLHQEGFIDESLPEMMVIESDQEKIIEIIKEEMK